MKNHTDDLSIEDLSDQTGVPVRTIRFYISQGLLPRPEGRGKATRYGRDHLLRLRLARLLSEQRVPLSEIRTRLTQLSLAEVQELLDEEQQAAEVLREADDAVSPKAYVSALLDRTRQPEKKAQTTFHLREPQPPFTDVLGHRIERPDQKGSVWLRWELAPGVELQVRQDNMLDEQELIDRILKLAAENKNKTRRKTHGSK